MLPSINSRPNSTTNSQPINKHINNHTSITAAYDQYKQQYHDEPPPLYNDENIEQSNITQSTTHNKLLCSYEAVLQSTMQSKLDHDILLSTTRDTRILQKHSLIQSQWDKLNYTAVLNSTDTYRSRIEHKHISTLLFNQRIRDSSNNDKSNSNCNTNTDNWQHTLRGHGESYVNIGNMFTSGLSMKVDTLKNDRSLHIIESQRKQSMDYIKRSQQLIQDNTELLGIYSGVGISVEQLQVVGTDLFELQSTVDNTADDKTHVRQDPLVPDMSPDNSSIADNAASNATITINDGIMIGPSVQLSSTNLSFTCIDQSSTPSQYVTLTNNGSTTIYYKWSISLSSIQSILKHNIQSYGHIIQPTTMSGTLLPNQSIPVEFQLLHHSDTKYNGIYNIHYALQTTPELRYNRYQQQQPDINIDILFINHQRTHCLATRLLKQQLQKSIQLYRSNSIVVQHMDTITLDHTAKRQLFYQHNPSLHYHTDTFDQLAQLSADVYKLHPRPLRYQNESWNYSCNKLLHGINNINLRHVSQQPELLHRYDVLLSQCKIRPKCNIDRYQSLYVLLHNTVNTIQRSRLSHDALYTSIKQQLIDALNVYDPVASPIDTDLPPSSTDHMVTQQRHQLTELYKQRYNNQIQLPHTVLISSNRLYSTIPIETESEYHQRIEAQNVWSNQSCPINDIPSAQPCHQYDRLLNSTIVCISSTLQYTICCTATYTYYIWYHTVPTATAVQQSSAENKRSGHKKDNVPMISTSINNNGSDDQKTIQQLCQDYELHELPELVSLHTIQLYTTPCAIYLLTDTGDLYTYNLQSRILSCIHNTVWCTQPLSAIIEPMTVMPVVPANVTKPSNKKLSVHPINDSNHTASQLNLTNQCIQQICVTTINETDCIVVLTSDHHVFSTQYKHRSIEYNNKKSNNTTKSNICPAVLGLGDKLPAANNINTQLQQPWYPINPLNTLPNNDTVRSIHSGISHCAALTAHGLLYVWGNNDNGELGLGDRKSRSIPVQLCMNNNTNELVEQVSCGHSHTVAVTQINNVYVWGSNEHGQLGTGNKLSGDKPILLHTLQNVHSTRLRRPVDTYSWSYQSNHDDTSVTESIGTPVLHVANISASCHSSVILLQQQHSNNTMDSSIIPWCELYIFGNNILQPTTIQSMIGHSIQSIRCTSNMIWCGIQRLTRSQIESVNDRGSSVMYVMNELQLDDRDVQSNMKLID